MSSERSPGSISWLISTTSRARRIERSLKFDFALWHHLQGDATRRLFHRPQTLWPQGCTAPPGRHTRHPRSNLFVKRLQGKGAWPGFKSRSTQGKTILVYKSLLMSQIPDLLLISELSPPGGNAAYLVLVRMTRIQWQVPGAQWTFQGKIGISVKGNLRVLRRCQYVGSSRQTPRSENLDATYPQVTV